MAGKSPGRKAFPLISSGDSFITAISLAESCPKCWKLLLVWMNEIKTTIFYAYNLGEAINTVEKEAISTVERQTCVPTLATSLSISMTQRKLCNLSVLQFPVL